MEFKQGDKFVVVHNDFSTHSFDKGEEIVFTGECDDVNEIYEMYNGLYWQWLTISEFQRVEENYLVAKVNFEGFTSISKGKKTYYFKCLFTDLKKGDVVVVDSAGAECKANFLGYVSENRIKTKPTKHILRKDGVREKVTIQDKQTEKASEDCPFKSNEKLVIIKKTSLYNVLKIGDIVSFDRIHKDGDIVVKDEKNCARFLKRDEVTKLIPEYDKENEMNLDFRLHNDTEELMYEIMNFHKEQYIDKCLENRDFDAIKKVI